MGACVSKGQWTGAGIVYMTTSKASFTPLLRIAFICRKRWRGVAQEVKRFGGVLPCEESPPIFLTQ